MLLASDDLSEVSTCSRSSFLAIFVMSLSPAFKLGIMLKSCFDIYTVVTPLVLLYFWNRLLCACANVHATMARAMRKMRFISVFVFISLIVDGSKAFVYGL